MQRQRTALKVAVGVGDVRTEDDLVEQSTSLLRASMLLELVSRASKHSSQECISGTTACAVED